MRVYFAPCGIGLGHVSRCTVIANLLKNKNNDILFSTYGDAVDYVKKHGFKVVTVPDIRMVERPDGTVDMKRTATKMFSGLWTFFKQLRLEIKYLKYFNPDIVISDTRLSTVLASFLLRKSCYLLTNQLRLLIPHIRKLTPWRKRLKKFGEIVMLHVLMLFWNRSTKILVADFPPELTISRATLDIPSTLSKKVTFVGPIIKIPKVLDKKNIDKIRLEYGVTKSNSYLIYAGISGTIHEVNFLVNTLVKCFLKFPDNYVFVVSKGNIHKRNIVKRKRNVWIFEWVDDRGALMNACDLFIGRPGQLSVAETFYLRKPAIWIPSPAHTEQISNAYSSRKMGVGILIQQKNITFNSLKKAIDYLITSSDVKKRLSYVQQESKKYLATETILSYLSHIISQ